MTTTKSLSTDFGGNIKTEQFHIEIVNSEISSGVLIGIILTGDVVEIIFDNALDGTDQTTLDTLISTHVPDNTLSKSQFFIVPTIKQDTKSNNYTKVATFKYPGSISSGTIDYIEIISYMDSGITSYSVRVVDKTNNLIIAEKNDITNTVYSSIDLGTISNVMLNSAIIELHVKLVGASGNAKVYIDNLIVYYNN